jgi:2-polyprenyl-3-methyl-5-hydroxy-6-metoxy-1,4-benzoquinol methylase
VRSHQWFPLSRLRELNMNVVRIAAGIASKAWLSRLLPVGAGHCKRDQWESQYSGGEWERLRHIDELPHYSVIAGYVSLYADRGSVLDVGCGEGILQEVLGRGGYRRYVGIDLAQAAILKASSKQDERTTFEQADAGSYSPHVDFDVVVFNEVLYYFDAPLEVIGRYAQHLADGGTTIVSMVVNERSLQIWRKLERSYAPEAEVLVANRTASWIVKAYRRGLIGSNQ